MLIKGNSFSEIVGCPKVDASILSMEVADLRPIVAAEWD